MRIQRRSFLGAAVAIAGGLIQKAYGAAGDVVQHGILRRPYKATFSFGRMQHCLLDALFIDVGESHDHLRVDVRYEGCPESICEMSVLERNRRVILKAVHGMYANRPVVVTVSSRKKFILAWVDLRYQIPDFRRVQRSDGSVWIEFHKGEFEPFKDTGFGFTNIFHWRRIPGDDVAYIR